VPIGPISKNTMFRKILFISGFLILVIVGALTFICALDHKRDPDREYNALFYRHTKIFAPEIPEKVNFSGESVPLDLIYVREAFEREIFATTFMHSSSLMMFKRAHRWFPVIEPILKKNGIPDDFKFLALAESNLLNTVSPAGAEGYWQIMKATGQKHGLEINDNIDERYNMVKATEAACDYFRTAYSGFRNWTLVAASYNRGMDGLDRALEKQQVASYYDLFLNDETSRYLYRILAIKEVYNHPVKYGFYLRESDFYQPFSCKQITVDTPIENLPAFAKRQGINYRILREMNPWIQSYTLPNKTHKQYIFLIPQEGALSYNAVMKKVTVPDHFFNDTLKIHEVH